VRFLNQASFGATGADIDRLMQIGYSAWLDEQFALPVQHSHLAAVNAAAGNSVDLRAYYTNDSMWRGLIPGRDQLRQRVMFALSQIHVVSVRDGSVYYWGRGLASYADVLNTGAFGNFRELIERITLNTAMGNYLSHIYNRKDNPLTGARPDQNYARELMQLFTIGLWELNPDGTRKLDSAGRPIPTYSTDDIVGVSRVLTGWAPEGATDTDWNNFYCFCQDRQAAEAQARPMRANARHHSAADKKFLGVTIAATSTPDPEGNLKILLDRLFNHPNVGPFIGRQLIQRLVTSNPTPAYVGRVAAAFDNNGQGVRGDMKAVVRAILLDPEARNAAWVAHPHYGKVREPIVRLGQVMRVFNATTSADPNSFGIGLWLYDRSKGLWQTPLGAPSVFNFYAPHYTPPNSTLARAGLVAPEMQIVTQSSVGDMSNYLLLLLQNGGTTDCCSEALRNTFYMRFDYSGWLPLVATPDQLVERLNLVFMAGQMSPALKDNIKRAMANRTQASAETSGVVRGNAQIRLAEALYTMLSSAEYVVQK